MPMNQVSTEWLIEHAAAAYESEIRSTEKVRERTGFIISTTITPIFGAIVYFVTTIRGNVFGCADILLFWLPLLLSILFLLGSSWLVAYVLHQAFKVLRPPTISQLVQYVEKHPDPNTVLQDTQSGLINEYAEAVDYNYKLNEYRKYKLLWAQRFAFYALALLIVFCFPKWMYNYFNNESKAQPVKILSPVSVQLLQEPAMSQKPENNSSSDKSTIPQQSKQAPDSTTPSNASAVPKFPKSSMALDSALKTKPEFPKGTMTLEFLVANKKSGK